MKALGSQVAVPQHYAPDVLEAIPRSIARESLGIGESLPFFGADVWHGWELSWRQADAVRTAVVRLTLPCDSSHIIESKSLKLYLNSLNNEHFGNQREVADRISADLTARAGAPVGVEVLTLADSTLAISELPGHCIDEVRPAAVPAAPSRSVLQVANDSGRAQLFSHSLRSLCPVTAQPDWATLLIEIEGQLPENASLLAYILSFSNHQEFHEQCAERVYADLQAVLEPEYLSVQALYTRRGGLDINPWRCSEAKPAPYLRTGRQ